MKTQKIRTLVAAAVFIFLSVGLVAGIGFGTLSGFGWDTISLLCPLGALASMIAARTLIPQALVSLGIMAVLVFIFGRAFCGWICPTQVFNRIKEFFRSPKKRKSLAEVSRSEALEVSKKELALKHDCSSCGGACGAAKDKSDSVEKSSSSKKLDSRHIVLGGALLSTAIFGFPVFCLVCPVGLSFATVMVVWRLFSAGDMTLSAILIPLMLIIELVFLRKWCNRVCPIAGLMNLVSRFSHTWRPAIDDSKCIETSKGVACGRCAEVCEAAINPRHPSAGEHSMADCTRCRACVDVCPSKAISMPVLPKKGRGDEEPVQVGASGDE